MSERTFITVDGNEAAAFIAHATNEVIAIYPITPASPMGELSDAWSSAKRPNIFGVVPHVIEMQSEAGAAASVHGALQAGSLTTTFTASQGLLLMIPEMFKIAGQLMPAVFHISARTVAAHALSIFGDHSDVMSVRSTGWAMLCSSTVQEVHDMAMISHAATLKARIPFLHFFDGFRTSHEVNKIEKLTEDDVRSMIDLDAIARHRSNALSPDHPTLRGTSQNPDVYFQSREASNSYYNAVPDVVRQAMDDFAKLVGRRYNLFDYEGDPAADRVIVLMGSGAGAVEEAVAHLAAGGEKVGLVKVRLYRPFDCGAFLDALPPTVKRIAVLDRTKEPGAIGEPLYQDVVTALAQHRQGGAKSLQDVEVFGGRYGLSSKEFTPPMAVAVYDELKKDAPRQGFTVGIEDDVTHLSLDYEAGATHEPDDVTRAVFYGLGSDGTVGASKNTVKIVGESTPLHAQGYFVYDSKKAGSVTVSHLRIGPREITSSYLIDRATFVGCHQFQFLNTIDVLKVASPGAAFLLNSPYGPDEVWDKLPAEVQKTIIDKKLRFYVVDAFAVAHEAGLRGRINTVMQTCFFALSGMLPRDEAIEKIKAAIKKTYGRRGQAVLDQNFAAVDSSLAGLSEVEVPATVTSQSKRLAIVGSNGSSFLNEVTLPLIAGQGDELPVSALPADGTFPTGTAKLEKRGIAHEIPIWDESICIACGLCALVCPHSAIRTKAYPSESLNGRPDAFRSIPFKDKELTEHLLTVQVAPDDCTGCGVCVDVCPAKSKEAVRHKAINMTPKEGVLEEERESFDYFLKLPEIDPTDAKIETVKGSQLLEPLFEYSGACAGCGETPYVKLMSQLFGDRALIGNATGCSSIYGGNLPTTPWTTNSDGRGPSWCNSLFEDNAEFGLGMRLAVDQQRDYAEKLLRDLGGQVGHGLVQKLLENPQSDRIEIARQRVHLFDLKKKLSESSEPRAKALLAVADNLVRRSVWAMGGDGWAYDIGFGGLDHVLASGRDVNILVLDTGVYSNTGGQASKSTPRAAVAKFAASGKESRRKDLGMLAVSYGNVYVAQVAMGANPAQTVRAFNEAESYEGPSLILAYSQCVAHGIDMTTGMSHQKEIVQCGLWPLYRYDPRLAREGERPFRLDSRKPKLPFKEVAMKEARFAMVARSSPEEAQRLFSLAQQDIDDQWHYYEQMAGLEREMAAEPQEVLA